MPPTNTISLAEYGPSFYWNQSELAVRLDLVIHSALQIFPSNRMNVAISIASTILLLSSPARAVITLLVSDDGTNTTFEWTGTLSTPGLSQLNTQTASQDQVRDNSLGFYSRAGLTAVGSGVTSTGADPVISGTLQNASSTYSGPGTGFGLEGVLIWWDPAIFGTNPTSLSPTGTFSFSGVTVADIFGTNLDAGPVTLWTYTSSSDTVQVALVPEPSQTSLLAITCGWLMVASRRRK